MTPTASHGDALIEVYGPIDEFARCAELDGNGTSDEC